MKDAQPRHWTIRARDPRALRVARRLLPAAVPHRPEDQLLADRDRAAALCAGARPRRRLGGLKQFFAALSLDSYASVFSNSLYAWSYWKSIQVAAISTAILLLIAYPVAYALARAPRRWQGMLVLLVVLPFWTSFLIRVYAWINILQHDGLLNQALLALRIIDAPVSWLATDYAVYIGIVYSYFPVHGAAALRGAGEDGRDAARSRRRSRRAAVAHVPRRDRAAVAARHRCGRAALLHSDHGRVRHSRSARLVVHRDDRPDAVARSSSPTATGRSPPRSRSCCSPSW